MTSRSAGGRGLLLDYGGVLTGPVAGSFVAFERDHGIEPGGTFALLVEASRTTGGGMIGALERGEMTVDAFDRTLAELLAGAGYDPSPDGSLLERLFAGMVPTGGMWEVASRVRDAGGRTGLLSNSWGTATYPRDRLATHFDVTVISGEVGLRKPDPAIYLLACERLGLAPEACAFVDDLERNVEVARELGMHAVVHHGDAAATADALTDFLGVEFVLPADEDGGTTGR